MQCLRECVNLIAVATRWKFQDLPTEFVEPISSAGQRNRSRFNAGGLRVHSHHLVALGVDGQSANILLLQVLNQGHAGAFVLDQKRIVAAGDAPAAVQLDHLAPAIGIFQPLVNDIQHVGRLIPDLEHYARRIAGEVFAAHRRIPAHNDTIASHGVGRRRASSRPACRATPPSRPPASTGSTRSSTTDSGSGAITGAESCARRASASVLPMASARAVSRMPS